MARFWQRHSAAIIMFRILLIFTAVLLRCTAQHFTNQWAVNIEGGEDVAKQLAERHGFTYVDKVC
jgi:Peptidase S8 pro-domain